MQTVVILYANAQSNPLFGTYHLRFKSLTSITQNGWGATVLRQTVTLHTILITLGGGSNKKANVLSPQFQLPRSRQLRMN